MLSNWFLFGLLCFAAVGCNGLPDGGVVGDGLVEERLLGGISEEQAGKVAKAAVGKSLAAGRWRCAEEAVAVVQAAQAEIGVSEFGENTGPRVDAYNAYVGLKGVPWCASFVSFCFWKAGFEQPRTAWSPALFPRSRCVTQRVISSRLEYSGCAETVLGLSRDTRCVFYRKEEGRAEPVFYRKGGVGSVGRRKLGAGLVFGIYYASKERIAHCGIVTSVDGDWILSVEGNTNADGGREGNGVYAKRRHRRTIAKYADWTGFLLSMSNAPAPSLREGTTKQSPICFGIVQWTDRVQGGWFFGYPSRAR